MPNIESPIKQQADHLATEDYYWEDAGNFTQFTGYYDVASGKYVATSGTAPTDAGTDVRIRRLVSRVCYELPIKRFLLDNTGFTRYGSKHEIQITLSDGTTAKFFIGGFSSDTDDLSFGYQFRAIGDAVASMYQALGYSTETRVVDLRLAIGSESNYRSDKFIYGARTQFDLTEAKAAGGVNGVVEVGVPLDAPDIVGFKYQNGNSGPWRTGILSQGVTEPLGNVYECVFDCSTSAFMDEDGNSLDELPEGAVACGTSDATEVSTPLYTTFSTYGCDITNTTTTDVDGEVTNTVTIHQEGVRRIEVFDQTGTRTEINYYIEVADELVDYEISDAFGDCDTGETLTLTAPQTSVYQTDHGCGIASIDGAETEVTYVSYSNGTRTYYADGVMLEEAPVDFVATCGASSGGTTAIAPQTYWGLDATGAVVAGSTFTGYLEDGVWYKVAPDGTASVNEPTADVVSIEEIVGGSVETTAAIDPTSIPYVMDVVADDPYNTGTKTANTLKASANQLPNGILADDQSSRNYADVIVFNGESVASTATSFTMTNVDFERRDAFIHIPATYRGNLDTVVKKVTLRDNGSGTGLAELLLSLDGQALTMDKGNTSVVLTQGGQFEIDPSQFGGFVYAIAQTDSSIDIKMDIEYIDASGNYQTVTEALTNYLRNPDEQIPQGTLGAQVRANLNSVAGQWTDTDGIMIPDAIMATAQNKQQLPVGQIPISGSIYYNTGTNTVTTSNVFGGSGTFTYISWDGGITWEPLTDLTVGDTSFMVSPRVRDSNGLISARLGWASNVDDTLLQWNLNTADASAQATSLVGIGGWETFRDASAYVGGSLKGEAVNTLSTPDIYEAWNAGLFGYGSDSGGIGTAVYLLDATHNPTGETIAFWGKGQQNRQGSTGELLDFTVNVYERTTDANGDPVKGALIGTMASWDADNTALFDGGASVTNVEFNSTDTFTGTGTDLWVELELLTGTSDGAGQWWGLVDAYFYKDPQFGRVNTSAYLYRNTAASIRWNNTDGVLVTNEHINTDDDILKPQFNFAYSGLVDGEFTLDIEYSLDGGPWVHMLSKDELTTSNGQADISYFLFDEGISVTEGSTMQYRITHTNENNGWLQLSATNTLAKLVRD